METPHSTELLTEEGLRQYARLIEEHKTFVSSLFDKVNTYIQLIIVGGYASFFGLWNLTMDTLSITEKRAAALFMVMSVVVFIGNAVTSMFIMSWTTITAGNMAQALQEHRYGDIQRISEKQIVRFKKFSPAVIKWSFLAFGIAVATGLIAFTILFYSYLKGLFASLA